MIKSTAAFFLVAGIGMFAYYFVTDRSGKPDGERATSALQKVGDAAVDQGMAGVAKGRLAVSLGIEGSRFVHTWYDEGKVLVYGLAPAGANVEQIIADLKQIPGVREVEVQILERPAYLDLPSDTATHATEPPASSGGAAQTRAQPAADAVTKARRTPR